MDHQLDHNRKLSVKFGYFFDKVLTILQLGKQIIHFYFATTTTTSFICMTINTYTVEKAFVN